MIVLHFLYTNINVGLSMISNKAIASETSGDREELTDVRSALLLVVCLFLLRTATATTVDFFVQKLSYRERKKMSEGMTFRYPLP